MIRTDIKLFIMKTNKINSFYGKINQFWKVDLRCNHGSVSNKTSRESNKECDKQMTLRRQSD